MFPEGGRCFEKGGQKRDGRRWCFQKGVETSRGICVLFLPTKKVQTSRRVIDTIGRLSYTERATPFYHMQELNFPHQHPFKKQSTVY